MSYRRKQVGGLSGVDFSKKNTNDLKKQFNQVLNDGMHGICFAAYEENQKPGNDMLTKEQIKRRMSVIAPHTRWVRSFSCIEGNELIPQIARKFALKTLVGAWLGKDKEKNDQEISALIQLAKEGFVDIAAVGNEVLYRNDLTEDELITHLKYVKQQLPNIPVGYVDAYYEFTTRPNITAMCDVILTNCYPFWEGCHADYSLLYMKQMYQQALAAGKDKKVIITETGWPSKGQNLAAAIPSTETAMKYFINTQLWSKTEKIDVFYFSSFDETWKTGPEGDVGAHWGIWDKNEKPKFS